MTEADWQNLHLNDSQTPRYLIIWTIKSDAPEPCRVFLLKEDDDVRPFEDRLKEHITQFRHDNGISGNGALAVNFALVQSKDSLQYAFSQLHEPLSNDLSASEQKAIDAQRHRIQTVITQSIDADALPSSDKLHDSVLEPFAEQINAQVRAYWSRLVRPAAPDSDPEQKVSPDDTVTVDAVTDLDHFDI